MNWNPYLGENIYLGNYGPLNVSAAFLVLWAVFLTALIIILLIKSGHGYSVNDTEAHAVNYAGVIREGHGGMTIFLWLLFSFMFVWTIIYFVQHAAEYAIWFAY
jgi:hypothetical protein